jgi:hypothetical protein
MSYSTRAVQEHKLRLKISLVTHQQRKAMPTVLSSAGRDHITLACISAEIITPIYTYLYS